MVKDLANNVVGGLKTQPLVLALVVMNLAFIAFTTFLAYRLDIRNTDEREYTQSLVRTLTASCLKQGEVAK